MSSHCGNVGVQGWPCEQRALSAFGSDLQGGKEMPSPQSYWKEWEAVSRAEKPVLEKPQM